MNLSGENLHLFITKLEKKGIVLFTAFEMYNMTKLEEENDFVQLERCVRNFYQTSDNMPCHALLSVEYMLFKKQVLNCISHHTLNFDNSHAIKAFLPGVNLVYCRNKYWLCACEPQDSILEKILFACADDEHVGKRKRQDE